MRELQLVPDVLVMPLLIAIRQDLNDISRLVPSIPSSILPTSALDAPCVVNMVVIDGNR